ncbi:MAG: AcrB/AcrD/AcrF family protein [Candidatus Eisenbacteria bacterium]|nr:AcrB/AcrD/AcrF family protein [Candidatus Latescibacterota bacterium]MBD3302312.1 AcrB/AcrD/AcrF family protein [Candidatus Eisenbacteria bacterium]
MRLDRGDVRGGGSVIDRLIRFCLENKLVVLLAAVFLIAWGIGVAPFDWDLGGLPRDPVPVDAIPDIGENQQIVFTEWMGRSPQDVEDQITYPMTVALLGIPGVKTIRSYSFFGFSTIYVIFEDGVEFYWSRSRVLEKLGSLPPGTLPEGVTPALGPDATALGQVFWYTLEGRDPEGNPTGGWGLDELRSIQDWYVRYGLQAADGVSEVASIGGHVREYQIDVDPAAMREQGIDLEEVYNAVRMSNLDVGARTIEVNRVEYVVRGLGFIQGVEDIEKTVVKTRDHVPITIADVAHVQIGPAFRRGVLDKEGAEAVGGVVVVRHGENPLAAIQAVKEKIAEISPGLPKKTLPDGTVSQVTIVPFYDRTGLIYETLGTLNTALTDEILVTIIVVILMLLHLRSSVLVAGLLPVAVLMTFIGMKLFKVDANIVALSGIAIAIGTIVDMGIVITENILKHKAQAPPGERPLAIVHRATTEVGGAVLTAILTTVISFLPVFTLTAAEGKLFKPLAYTKTFALIASIIVALTIIPAVAQILFFRGERSGRVRRIGTGVLLAAVGLWIAIRFGWLIGLVVIVVGLYRVFRERIPAAISKRAVLLGSLAAVLVVGVILTEHWLPLGPEKGLVVNVLFVALLIAGVMVPVWLYQRWYEPILRWCLAHKRAFLAIPAAAVLFGLTIWLGFPTVFGFVPGAIGGVGIDPTFLESSRPWVWASHKLPGLGKEFMPNLDEGSYLYMPTTMPHASMEEAIDVMQKLDQAIYAIPEVETVVGKMGRVDSSLDPAPLSMLEAVINYKPEYVTDESGHRLRFRYDEETEEFARDEAGQLIPDPGGRPYRNWRPEIRDPDDIWDEIVRVAKLPGTTSAPKLQPIATRIVMLQSGMRAPMGVKVRGPDLETIERVGLEIEQHLKDVPGVLPASVLADRIVGKPYLEIVHDRDALARYGLSILQVQEVVEVAIGGKRLTTTVEGRERYPVRVRYQRELRNDLESLGEILVPTPGGAQVPLEQLAEIRYVRGPQVIKSEDTFLVGYVVFDKQDDAAEVDVVQRARAHLDDLRDAGVLEIPPGVSYSFAGSYENQVRSEKTLAVVLPLALFLIFLILYFQFRRIPTTLLVFSGIFVAWAGGFILSWLYGQPWCLDFSLFGTNLRELFAMGPMNLSVAVWVGFLALFGIATDDGVIMATYQDQVFRRKRPATIDEVRNAVVEAGKKRIRPALMTAATTILALVPVLTSTGRGSDVMVPMAIPSFGGMCLVLITVLVVPTIYSAIEETRVRRAAGGNGP